MGNCVCNSDGWIRENSNVACRQLGFSQGAASPTGFAVSSAVG